MENKKTFFKIFIFLIILVILCLAWVGSYWLKYKHWPWADIRNAIEKSENQPVEESVGNNENAESKKTEEEIKSELFRQGTMSDLAAKIGKISPVQPVLGGKWFITRFWFADNRNLYIEYEDGHIMVRILVEVLGQEEKPEYKVVAYFEPGENDWILKTGKDTMLGKKLDLYEYDESKGEWVERN